MKVFESSDAEAFSQRFGRKFMGFEYGKRTVQVQSNFCDVICLLEVSIIISMCYSSCVLSAFAIYF
jgi:hypothetical protein